MGCAAPPWAVLLRHGLCSLALPPDHLFSCVSSVGRVPSLPLLPLAFSGSCLALMLLVPITSGRPPPSVLPALFFQQHCHRPETFVVLCPYCLALPDPTLPPPSSSSSLPADNYFSIPLPSHPRRIRPFRSHGHRLLLREFTLESFDPSQPYAYFQCSISLVLVDRSSLTSPQLVCSRSGSWARLLRRWPQATRKRRRTRCSASRHCSSASARRWRGV
eukprot:768659-Hanusia_phi.AAC.2